MTKDEAHKIIKSLFESEYSEDNYIKFVANLLNYYDPINKVYENQYVRELFRSNIKQYKVLGTYKDAEGSKLDILSVVINQVSTLTNARTTQRNFVADYLKRNNKESALVAFHVPNSKEWRLSFVKLEYSLITDGNKVKTTEEITPAKRWSFLVGETEGSHTAQTRFVDLMVSEIKPTKKEIETAFDIEKVTNEFFTKYKELFFQFKECLDVIIEKDKELKQEFTAKNISSIDFAKKTLGQIVFLYFLQKKGWFGVLPNQNWGTGLKNFIRELFNKREKYGKNFFNDVLEPLFYEALAQDRGESSLYQRLNNCRMPFLNGGLFEPMNDYQWETTKLDIPDHIFSNSNKNKSGDIGDGILDVFDRYNFTVNENEPLEKEVAVDPEMLGKVFENLLEVKDRSSKGTFYTPRQIVHYMCQQSLINYLTTQLGDLVPYADIDFLINKGEAIIENDVLTCSKIKEKQDDNLKRYGDKDKYPYTSDTYKIITPESITNNSIQIDKLLQNIKIADPAVGSGAFPMGMINEIVRTRKVLQIFKENKLTEYDLKLQVISESIHGVDIDPGAVEIAKLRLWLSLVVDADVPHPLPNLEHKIMQGNSLVTDYEGIKLFDENAISGKNIGIVQDELVFEDEEKPKILDELNIKIKEFLSESQRSKKQKLKKEIDELKWDLIETTLKIENKTNLIQQVKELRYKNIKPFFIWKLEFNDVFRLNGGFDVIIGNPPYIDSETMIKSGLGDLREYISNNYSLTTGNWDIYIAFFEMGFGLLSKSGGLIYITPDKWLSKSFGISLRSNLINNLNLLLHAGRDIFESAKVDSIVSYFSKKESKQISIYQLYNKDITKILDYDKSSLKEMYYLDFLFSPNISFLSKIEELGNTLIDFGLAANACATSDAYKLKEFVEDFNDGNIQDFYKIVNTGSIDKYISKWGNKEMKYLGEKYLNPVVKKDIFNKKFTNSYGKKIGYPKLIMKGLNLLDVSLDSTGDIIPAKTTIVIESKKYLLFLLGLLNSSLPIFYIKNKYPASSYNGGTTFTKDMINNFPIPILNSTEKQKITFEIKSLVEQILELKNEDSKADISEQENKIDTLVFDLYELDQNERNLTLSYK